MITQFEKIKAKIKEIKESLQKNDQELDENLKTSQQQGENLSKNNNSVSEISAELEKIGKILEEYKTRFATKSFGTTEEDKKEASEALGIDNLDKFFFHPDSMFLKNKWKELIDLLKEKGVHDDKLSRELDDLINQITNQSEKLALLKAQNEENQKVIEEQNKQLEEAKKNTLAVSRSAITLGAILGTGFAGLVGFLFKFLKVGGWGKKSS